MSKIWKIRNEKPTIVAVAVHCYDVTFTLEASTRHGCVLMKILDAGLYALEGGSDVQGFLCSEGKFIDRVEAGKIAIEAG